MKPDWQFPGFIPRSPPGPYPAHKHARATPVTPSAGHPPRTWCVAFIKHV